MPSFCPLQAAEVLSMSQLRPCMQICKIKPCEHVSADPFNADCLLDWQPMFVTFKMKMTMEAVLCCQQMALTQHHALHAQHKQMGLNDTESLG